MTNEAPPQAAVTFSRRVLAVVLALAVIGVPAQSVQAQRPSTDATQVAALIGLARTARDQGRFAEAVEHFRAAERLQRFDASLLAEFFWAAHRADATTAQDLGRRILQSNARESSVRDSMIGLLVSARDEAAIQALARAGATADPAQALWPRRLAESLLRAGDRLGAAEHYARAGALEGGTSADRAMRALALEAAGDRAAAHPPAPAVRRTATPTSPPPGPRVPTPDEIVAASRHALAGNPCALEPLSALDQLPDKDAFIAAVASRGPRCPGHASWAARATEAAIAVGRFSEALRVVEPAVTGPDVPLMLREQYGILLHWTGDHLRAEPVLRAVAAEAPGGRATDALIDVLRANGRPDAAWPLALAHWDAAGSPVERRAAVASLALETGRFDEALTRARALAADPAVGVQAKAIAAGALLAYGRGSEAKAELGILVPEPGSALAWIDAVAATDGVAAALRAAEPIAGRTERPWADVIARRASWYAQTGQHRDSERVLGELDAVDQPRAALARGEIALAMGRPAEAIPRLTAIASRAARKRRALGRAGGGRAVGRGAGHALAAADAQASRRGLGHPRGGMARPARTLCGYPGCAGGGGGFGPAHHSLLTRAGTRVRPCRALRPGAGRN